MKLKLPMSASFYVACLMGLTVLAFAFGLLTGTWGIFAGLAGAVTGMAIVKIAEA